MPTMLLRARRALLPGGLAPADVLVSDGVISSVGAPSQAAPDVEVDVLSPGFVDLHVHSLDGCGTVGAGAPDVPGLSRALARRGVTSFLATTAAARVDDLVAALAPVPTEGARCLGLHLEGPWLSTAHAGAQPRDVLIAPTLADLERLLAAGPPVMVTLAPELPGASKVLRRAVDAGVVVSLGHSGATYDEAVAAMTAGARHVTHCFNAMTGLHHRAPGLAGAALDCEDVTVEAIADGVHLHPAVVRLLWRACGAERVCLVSDAVDLDGTRTPAPSSLSRDHGRSAPPGGGAELPRSRGEVRGATRLEDGTLAGSGIGLDTAVRNVVAWGIPLTDALRMASTTPARVVGRQAALVPGAPADLVLLDDGLEVAQTVVGGEVVWQR